MDSTKLDPADLLVSWAAQWGLAISPFQLTQFETYAEALVRYNAHTNLTAITDKAGIYVRHFLDSLALAPELGPDPGSLVDLGSGAGFPGLPLKLVCPTLQLTLVDSVGKKTAFLHALVAELGLEQVRIITGRAETLGRDPAEREQHTLVTARAVADLRVLAEYGLPLLRIGGRLLAPKGADAAQEVALAQTAVAQLGGKLERISPVQLPGIEARSLVVITKVRPTAARFPRPVGVATRRPLGGN
ncbi:MAG: 16S rRNA (guanine(527)-N(7))-methyltransferase RsmG [Oscillochloridaceae bacterium umkhey_bin13]